ncbi:MAG: hypothetical protein IKD45_04505 [Clostridia bacterium]|nr:hypothetical protein [Clostridia bacterium]
MNEKWYLVIRTEETCERNNQSREYEYEDRYELAQGLSFYLPGQREKCYIRSVISRDSGVDVVLVKPVEYAEELSSDKPLDMYYSTYRESCGDGIDERYRVHISIEHS